jgi:hypothetical protein
MHEVSDLIRRRIVHGMPAAEYHAVEAIGSSTVRALISSTPAHAKYALSHGEQSESQALGTAVHAAILEPHTFLRQIAIAPDVDRRTKEGKERWASFQETSAGRTVITHDQGEQLRRMKEAFDACKTATALLQKCQHREVSIFAADIVHTKARLDAYAHGIVVDVKTTRGHASRKGFEGAISQYGYGIQAAHYRRVCHQAKVPCTDFMFIVMETAEPYGVAVYRLEDEVIDLYDQMVQEAMEVWRGCLEEKRFRAYPDAVQSIGVPAWLRRQLQEGQVAA